MSTPISLIVGLGNPGPDYAETRHNAGFWFLDAVAAGAGAAFRRETKFHGEVCRARVDGHEVWLLKPMTYMNHSGRAVAALARFYKVPAEAILVAHDELDLPPGQLKLKEGGGHAGHNGLRDTISHLGGNGFLRLRLGVGHPGSAEQVTPYVLHRPGRAEREQIDEAIAEGVAVLPRILAGELDLARNRLHSRK